MVAPAPDANSDADPRVTRRRDATVGETSGAPEPALEGRSRHITTRGGTCIRRALNPTSLAHIGIQSAAHVQTQQELAHGGIGA